MHLQQLPLGSNTKYISWKRFAPDFRVHRKKCRFKCAFLSRMCVFSAKTLVSWLFYESRLKWTQVKQNNGIRRLWGCMQLQVTIENISLCRIKHLIRIYVWNVFIQFSHLKRNNGYRRLNVMKVLSMKVIRHPKPDYHRFLWKYLYLAFIKYGQQSPLSAGVQWYPTEHPIWRLHYQPV